MHHPTDRITHTTTFVTPVVEHWLERERCNRQRCVFAGVMQWFLCSPVIVGRL